MIKTFLLAGAAALALASPALAQSEDDGGYDGFYIGGSFGYSVQNNDIGSFVQFDRNRDGVFGDVITTAAGANAFSTGFCNGAAVGPTQASGCINDKDGIEYAARIGGDAQFGRIVVGIVGEAGRPEINDSVTAFSTTPANYVYTRSVDLQASIRGRIGFTPDNKTLFYAAGGPSYARIDNAFRSTNTANAFTQSGRNDEYGYQVGGGVERRFGAFAIGLEYMYNDFDDDETRVFFGPGTAPATNPFLLGGSGGTNTRRNDRAFLWHTGRVTATFRF